MSTPQKGFLKGSTVVLMATVRQENVAFDPDTVVLTLFAVGGISAIAKLDSTAFVHQGAGLYQLHIDTADLDPGQYVLVVTGTHGSDVALTKDDFTVLPLPAAAPPAP